MATAIDNQSLYDLGRLYAGRIEVAKTVGKGVKEVRTAFDFFHHVEAINKSVPGSRRCILASGHPHLTPAIVAQIAKSTEAEIRTRWTGPRPGSIHSHRTLRLIWRMNVFSGISSCPG